MEQEGAARRRLRTTCLRDQRNAINDQIDALSEEADALQTAYAPEDLARAGVFATWNNGVQISVGLVRPEDAKQNKPSAAGSDATEDDGSIRYAASLEADLKTERAMALGAALAQNPEVALDLTLFKLVTDVVLHGSTVTHGFGVSASAEHRTHARLDEVDPTSRTQMEDAAAHLSLDWADVFVSLAPFQG